MQKIVFRADADAIIGFGHFTRTLALADMLKDDFECVFYTAGPDDYQKSEIAKVCRMVELPVNESKFDKFLDCLHGDEIVFLDNYFFTPDYEKAIKNKNCKLVVLSPADRHHFADVVINYVDKDFSHYSVEPYSKILAGLEWTILREPFRRSLISDKRQNGSVVVSMGGTDQFCLTEKVLAGLDCNNVSVICTSKVPVERLSSFKSKGAKVYVDIDAYSVADLFETAEWSILSSSTICLEALSRGSKVISGYYIDNQVNFYNVLLCQKAIIGIGNLMMDSSYQLLRNIFQNCQQTDTINIDFSDQKQKYLNIFKSIC